MVFIFFDRGKNYTSKDDLFHNSVLSYCYCMYCTYLCVPYCACLYYLGSQEFLCITKSPQRSAFKAVAASCDTFTEWPYILMLLARVTHGIMELIMWGG